jgi:hypothetical protein
LGPDFEPQQNFRLVGEVTDDAAQRRRQLLYQGRRGEDLLILSALRVLQNVNYLELVLPVKLLLADALEIGDCDLGARTRSGDVQRQQVFGQDSSSLDGREIDV